MSIFKASEIPEQIAESTEACCSFFISLPLSIPFLNQSKNDLEKRKKLKENLKITTKRADLKISRSIAWKIFCWP